jgi:ABC-2 type transport system permease protein
MTAVSALAGHRASTLRITLRLAWRSLMLVARVPATFLPMLVFPVFSVVAFGGAFSAVARVPGFPAETMIDWMVPFAAVQGAAFSGVMTGLGVARDLESGFFDRLLLSPGQPVALVTGPMVAAMGRALFAFTTVLVVGLFAEAHLPGGPLGLVTLLAAVEGTAVVAAGFAVGMALRFGSMKVAPLVQSALFLVMFLSTAQVPLTVMTGWLHGVARFNPMTNVLRLAREGFVGEVGWDGTWGGLVALGVGALLFGWFAVRGLRKVTT